MLPATLFAHGSAVFSVDELLTNSEMDSASPFAAILAGQPLNRQARMSMFAALDQRSPPGSPENNAAVAALIAAAADGKDLIDDSRAKKAVAELTRTRTRLDAAGMSAIPALKNHLAQPDETARTPRDADTQSACQFPSQRASSCAFLLRPVSPAPLFTLADASLTLPMGSQTDTSRMSIERLSGRAGVRSAALRQRRLTQRRPHAATGEDLRWTPGRSPG
jgi:hypothetical protein